MAKADVYAVIMAGGSGTRFWPASRKNKPKQFLALGRSGEPLLVETVRRLSPLIPEARVLVVTGKHLEGPTREALPNMPASNVLFEPAARNTAPCIAWAAAEIAARDPEALVCVLPSDHAIDDEPAFRAALARALDFAETGTITTIGVVPHRPDTGYGYIEFGEDLAAGVKRGVRFVEKPDHARAQAFVQGGAHLWNAGMFFFRAKDMLEAIGKHQPDMRTGIERIVQAKGSADEASALASVFPTLNSISIDHGVMEKLDRMAVVPASFGWSDVGSWQAAWELALKDERDNGAPEGTILVESNGNLVRALDDATSKKVYALVGVNDLVVVDTGDALLIMSKSHAQDVRKVVDALAAQERKETL